MSSPSHQSSPGLPVPTAEAADTLENTSSGPSKSAPQLTTIPVDLTHSASQKTFASTAPVSSTRPKSFETFPVNFGFPFFQDNPNDSKLPRAKWKSPAMSVLLSTRSFLAALVILIAVILTLFSKGGALFLDGVVIKWKLFIYSIQLELMLLVLVPDLMVIGIDYFLVVRGITFRQLGHALSFVTSPFRISSNAYRLLLLVVALCGAITPPVLLSVVLDQTHTDNARIPINDQLVNTNCIGGRANNQFCMTGQSYLFNMSFERFIFNKTRQNYVIYLDEGAIREVFVPKTPQIGPYLDDCNINGEDARIVEATVFDVQGLHYTCRPTIREDPIDIRDFKIDPKFSGTQSNSIRMLADDHRPDPSAEDGVNAALFNVTLALYKGDGSTAILTIPCRVTSALADISVKMTSDGIMNMNITGAIRTTNEELPARVIGEDNNLLDRTIENSIGARTINVWGAYPADQDSIKKWDGIIRALVGAYGIRSAIRDTFADRDEKKRASNIKRSPSNDEKEHGEPIRVGLIWIPVVIVLASRLLTIMFPSIFTDGLPQLLCWMGVDNGRAGGTAYSELDQVEDKPAKVFLGMEEVEDGRSILQLQRQRDGRMGIGSLKFVRRRSGKGLVRGLQSENSVSA